MYKVKVNGKAAQLKPGKLLPALREAGFKVPSVCWHPDVVASGGRCRVCVCKVDNRQMTPCNMEVQDGMDIVTESTELTHDRAAAFALLPHSHHQFRGDYGPAQDTAELEEITGKYVLLPEEQPRVDFESLPIDRTSKHYVIAHPEKCVHCGLCVQMCAQIQGLGAIADMRKPFKKPPVGSEDEGGGVHAFHNESLFLSECVSCGQCINVCPYGALEEMPEVEVVEKLLKDPDVVTVVQFAPAVRVALAEEFGAKAGERIVTKEMVGALRRFAKNSYIYDTCFTADLTIVEEGAELLERLRRVLTDTRKFGPENDHMSTALPLITSCSPGWVLFAEKNYHDLLPNLSSCKSPQQMHGALTKHYFAKKLGFDRKKIKAISIMPCVAKKAEKDRPEFSTDGVPDVDHVLTTREYATLLKKNNIDLLSCEEGAFDDTFGFSTGAGMIFGASGGVMEAALRTAYNIVTGRDVPFKDLEITPVRGMEGVRQRTIPFRDVLPEWKFLEGVDLNVAVAHGISNARKLMDHVRERKEAGLPPEFHFIEVMCCPGGCLGGGGQPKPTNMEIKAKRGKLVYEEAHGRPMHRSHDNPRVLEAYKELLGDIGGPTAHKLLHTHYTPRFAASHALLESDDAKAVKKHVLSHYPRTRARLTNLVSDVVDHYGWVTDGAVAAIAEHCQVTPVEIDSILSHYHYFSRHQTPDSMLYVCECPNCRQKGSIQVKEYLKKNKIQYHVTSWLGWCVNGAPAALVKHKGDPRVHGLLNIDVANDDHRLHHLDTLVNPLPDLRYRLIQSREKYGKTAPSILARLSVDEAKAHATRVTQQALKLKPETIVEQLKFAGLRGCGGAGFPTHIKWSAVMKEADTIMGKYVVINADEGLPSVFKDYHLLQDPAHCIQLMCAIGIAAHVTGARNGLLYLRYEYKNLRQQILDAFDTYVKECNPAMKTFKFEVVLGAGPYVCGEETALFESVEGHLPQARVVRSVFPTHHGVFAQPTLVNNVETLCWVNQIVEHGYQAYKHVTTGPDQIGLKLLTVTGDVKTPVLGEFAMGSTLESILEQTCGFPVSEVAAVEVGGIVEPLRFAGDFRRVLSLDNKEGHLSAGGSIVVYRRGTFNERAVYTGKAKFANLESCQLCAPCREGTAAFRHSIHSLFDGSMMEHHNDKVRERLKELAVAMEHSSNCGHGKASGTMASNLLDRLETRRDDIEHDGTFC